MSGTAGVIASARSPSGTDAVRVSYLAPPHGSGPRKGRLAMPDGVHVIHIDPRLIAEGAGALRLLVAAIRGHTKTDKTRTDVRLVRKQPIIRLAGRFAGFSAAVR